MVKKWSPDPEDHDDADTDPHEEDLANLADDDIEDFTPKQTKKKSHHKPKTKAKNKFQDDFDRLGDDEETLNEPLFEEDDAISKPEWTGYNSREGYIIFPATKEGKRYYNGDRLPNGSTCIAPKLDWDAWAKLFEEFQEFHLEPSQTDPGEYELVGETKPAKLNKLDRHFMDCCAKYKRLLFLAHRNFHKSVNLTRWAKICAADYGDTILYAGSTAEEAVKFTQALRDEFMLNETFKKWYGYIINDKVGNQKNKMYWVSQRRGAKRESTRFPGCTTCTPKNKRTGAHPRRIFVDDVVSEEVLEHPRQIEFIRNWFFKSIIPMCSPDTQIVMVGTIKDKADIYSEILLDKKGHKGFHVEVIPAIRVWPNQNQHNASLTDEPTKWSYIYDKNGVVCGVKNLQGGTVGNDEFFAENWQLPSRIKYYLHNDPAQGLDGNLMSMQEFLIMKSIIGSAAFETEYQLSPTSVTRGYLKLDNIRYFEYNEPKIPSMNEFAANTYAMFDQALGSNNTSDYNSIAVVSAVQNELTKIWEYYILDAFIWRGGGVLKKEQMVRAVKAKYPFIKGFGIEAGLSNAGDLDYLKEHIPDENIIPVYQNKAPKHTDPTGIDQKSQSLNLDFSDLPQTKLGKIRRIINQWDTKLELGQVYMRRGIGINTTSEFTYQIDEEIDIDPMIELEHEKAFPKCKHFDLLDSIGSCFDLCETVDPEQDFFALYGYIN